MLKRLGLATMAVAVALSCEANQITVMKVNK